MESTIRPQKLIRMVILTLAMIGLSNCNQFASFSGSEEDAFLSDNPVFADPVENNIGSDPFDDGFAFEPPVTNPPVEDPNTDNPVVTPPTVTNPPVTNPPVTNPPVTNPPVTNPPVTNPPVTNPPVTNPPVTNPPVTNPPVTNPPVTEPPVTEPPVTEPPVTEPPVTTPTPRPNPTPTPRPTFNGGGDGGDGGGDPLMLDTVGVEYTRGELKKAAKQLRNSNDSYFKSGDLDLSSPEEGTRFNLLGQQTRAALDEGFLHINEAGKNFRYQISWVQSDQTRYQFLVLPDENGNVLGIDQLFGDNTFGPRDRRPFATDGFAALRKWDRGDFGNEGRFSEANGYIDANDAIFSKLRLWHDRNRNGVVTNARERQSELMTLDQAGIAAIHLSVNMNFTERDSHKNVIMYKALVHFRSKDDKVRLGTAFDMWFRYDPTEVIQQGRASRSGSSPNPEHLGW